MVVAKTTLISLLLAASTSSTSAFAPQMLSNSPSRTTQLSATKNNDNNNQSFIYVFGGLDENNEAINSIEKYDSVDNSKWSLIELSLDLFPARAYLGAIQLNEFHILVFGGEDNIGVNLDDSYLFDVEK